MPIRLRLAVTLFLLLLSETAPAAAPARKLNVLWIVADDLGYADTSCYGSKDISTPHIDALARGGVRLTSAYAYPTCSPTRASILTGRYAERFGVTSALMGENPPRFSDAVTIAKILHDDGYVTAAVGKWHLGYTGDVLPLRKGFDSFYGFRGGKIDFFGHTDTAQKVEGSPEGKHDFYDNDTEIFPTGQYTTDLFTRRACELLKGFAGGGKPFYLYLAYNAPHYAKVGLWQAPEEYLKRFHAEGRTSGRGVYAAMVSCLDDGIGRVLGTLRDLHLDGETLVVFTSDNGGEGSASNAPFRGGKHAFTEGGLRVDQIWRLPGRLTAGSVSDLPVHVVDFVPTTLAALDVEAPAGASFDGVNLWGRLSNPRSDIRDQGPERPIYLGDHALRKGRYKLLDGKLFDLGTDPQEKTDLAATHPDVLGDLGADLTRWEKNLDPAPSAHWPTLADGEFRYPAPENWSSIAVENGERNAVSYRNQEGFALLTIHVMEQNQPIPKNPDVALSLGRQMTKAITNDLRNSDAGILTPPTPQRDPRFLCSIRDRIRLKGVTSDRLQIYKAMGYFLVRVTVQVDDRPKEDVEAAFGTAQDLLDRAVLGPRDKKVVRDKR